jgi:hypothetical protein
VRAREKCAANRARNVVNDFVQVAARYKMCSQKNVLDTERDPQTMATVDA